MSIYLGATNEKGVLSDRSTFWLLFFLISQSWLNLGVTKFWESGMASDEGDIVTLWTMAGKSLFFTSFWGKLYGLIWVS